MPNNSRLSRLIESAPSPVRRRLPIISAGPAALDSVALSLTVGRQGSSGAHRGRHGSARRNQRGRGSVDYVALAAAAGMSGSRGSTSGTLLSSFTSRQSSADSQEAPHSLFDALLKLKVSTGWFLQATASKITSGVTKGRGHHPGGGVTPE